MIAGISYLDAALVAVVALSGLVAMYRGLTREVLSILSWATAALATFYVIFYQRGWASELARPGSVITCVCQPSSSALARSASTIAPAPTTSNFGTGHSTVTTASSLTSASLVPRAKSWAASSPAAAMPSRS